MTDDALDFMRLRSRGMAHLQALAGQTWTDYNLHDPGVTLLESLVYGLTDVAYRLDFDEASLLAGPDGLDLEALGLLPPERALATRPTSVNDIRRAILERVPVVEDAWIRRAGALQPDDPLGLVDIFVWTGYAGPEVNTAATLAAVRRAFDAVRGIGEDADRIAFAAEIGCRLKVSLEVERDREPETIVADVLGVCARLLGREPEPRSAPASSGDAFLLEPAAAQPSAERRGFTPADVERTGSGAPEVFVRAVGQVEGVLFVRELGLQPTATIEDGDDRPVVLELRPPKHAADLDGIELTSRGRRLLLDGSKLQDRLFTPFRAESVGSARPATSPTPPAARPLPLSEYTLVQHHLPPAYAVPREGLAPSTPTLRRARARQLRGYLLTFEQLLKGSLNGLDDLDRLFAARGASSTYPAATGLRELLPDADRDLCPADASLDVIRAGRDDVDERRGRVLDYLLGLYGEAFTQNSLRTFDLYSAPGELQAHVVANRETFLHDIERLTRERGAAADLQVPAATGGFARRIAVLLDLATSEGWFGAALTRHDLHLDADAELALVDAADAGPPGNPLDGLVPLTDDGLVETASERFARLRAQGLLAAGPLHPEVLEAGIHIERYGLSGKDGAWALHLDLAGDGRRLTPLGRFTDRRDAVAAANRLRASLIDLNRAGEGFYVVEDVLLRRRAAADARLNERLLRLNVVLPGWTPRLRQRGFRQLVDETVRINCPAHVVPSCRWIDDAATFLAFEAQYDEWRAALAEFLAAPRDRAAARHLDEAADALEQTMAHGREVRW